MTKIIQHPPIKRRFSFVAVDQSRFEADWIGIDGREQTVIMFASEVVFALHEIADLGHELIRVSYDCEGNYSVTYQAGEVTRREDLPAYTQRYATRYADKLIGYIETRGVVEDFLMDQTAA